MTGSRYTLDTNILIYSVDRSAGEKHAFAVEIVNRSIDEDCILTAQALGEFFIATTRKGLVPRSAAAAQVQDWLDLFPVTAAGREALETALPAVQAGRFAFWDALLLATAQEAGCTIVISEDMRDGATLDEIVVKNPFGASESEVRRLLGMA